MLYKYYFLSCKVIFEPPGGATPEALHYFVGKVCDIPLEKLNVAKYLRAKYEWLVIKDTDGTQVNSLFKFTFPVIQILQRPLCHNCTKRHIAISVKYKEYEKTQSAPLLHKSVLPCNRCFLRKSVSSLKFTILISFFFNRTRKRVGKRKSICDSLLFIFKMEMLLVSR